MKERGEDERRLPTRTRKLVEQVQKWYLSPVPDDVHVHVHSCVQEKAPAKEQRSKRNSNIGNQVSVPSSSWLGMSPRSTRLPPQPSVISARFRTPARWITKVKVADYSPSVRPSRIGPAPSVLVLEYVPKVGFFDNKVPMGLRSTRRTEVPRVRPPPLPAHKACSLPEGLTCEPSKAFSLSIND